MGFGEIGNGLRSNYKQFGKGLKNYIAMDYLRSGTTPAHELSHNLGNIHVPPNGYVEFDKRLPELMRRFRFAIAAVGDEREQCQRQEAAQEFRY